ncbi:MAG: MliC family protein [Rhodoferax sp.]|nr:MliC family protein [Pseudorhodobacter sp.]
MADMNVQNNRYTCERGVQVPVVYADSGDSAIAVLMVEGNQILLYSEPAASGARYGWPSDGSNYVWLTNGNEAKLLWHDGTTNTETTLLAACTQT